VFVINPLQRHKYNTKTTQIQNKTVNRRNKNKMAVEKQYK